MSLRFTLETFFSDKAYRTSWCSDTEIDFPLAPSEKQKLIQEQIAIFQKLALNSLVVLDNEISKPENSEILPDAIEIANKIDKYIKIYTIFYAALLVVSTTLLFLNYLSFPTFGYIVMAATTLNLLIQWAIPLLALKKITDFDDDPYENIYDEVTHVIQREFKVTYIKERKIKKSLAKTNAWIHLIKKHKPELIKGIVKLSEDIVNSELLNGYPAELIMPHKPSIIRSREIISLITTIVIIVFTTIRFFNISPYIIASAILINPLPNLFLRNTLENRILTPLGTQTLSKEEAAQIKQRFTLKINQICV